jgi:hypothetical protein
MSQNNPGSYEPRGGKPCFEIKRATRRPPKSVFFQYQSDTMLNLKLKAISHLLSYKGLLKTPGSWF